MLRFEYDFCEASKGPCIRSSVFLAVLGEDVAFIRPGLLED